MNSSLWSLDFFSRTKQMVATVALVALVAPLVPLGTLHVAHAASATVLFEDDFESAGDLTGWTASEWFENDWGAGNSRAATVVGPTVGGAGLRQAATTEGYDNIVLAFDYRIRNDKVGESGDRQKVDWTNDGGETWTTLVDFSETSQDNWTTVSYPLPAGADNAAGFEFRFAARFTDNSIPEEFEDVDHFRIDNVRLTGESLTPECSLTSTFDDFTLGSVDGQMGWKSMGPFDQAIVKNVYDHTESFGCQTLRISNAVTSGSFGDQTFSSPVATATGETGVATNNHFEAEFDIASTMLAEQPGLFLSVSPDDGSGSRMSYLSFTDTPSGIDVTFYDVTNAGPLPTTSSFNPTAVATLDRSVPHTVKFEMDFVDGPGNDVVNIYIDGALVHTGTSWEDYYRFDPEQTGNGNILFPVDRLIFRASGGAVPANSGEGFLVDNFALGSESIPNEPPPTPTHIAPANGSIFAVGALGVIDWTDEVDPAGPGAGPVHYVYQSSHSAAVDGSGALSSPLYTSGPLAVSEIDASGTAAGVYYWQVKAVDPQGNESDWSAPWKIIVSDSPATLIVEKVLVQDNGGTEQYEDFSFTLNDGAPTAFEADGTNEIVLDNENFDVAEIDYFGYKSKLLGACTGVIAPGETKTCTIENDDIAPKVKIKKETIGGDDTFDFVFENSEEELVAEKSITTEGNFGATGFTSMGTTGTVTLTEETLPTDWDFTSVSCTSNTDVVTEEIEQGIQLNDLAIGDRVICVFTNTKRGSISVEKISNPAAGSFQFDLTGPNEFADTTTFSPEGVWEVPSLVPGSYTLSETIISPEDWSGSQAIVCEGDGDNDSEGSIATPFDLTLNAGEGISCIVNNTQDAVISGKKFNDTDGEGEGTDGEGVVGWNITLEQYTEDDVETEDVDESGWSEVETDVTDEEGDYSFLVQPGTYRVCEVFQDDWYQSFPIDATADSTGNCAEGYGYEFTVEAGGVYGGNDFGNFTYGSITGNKFEDTDADGAWDTESEDAEEGLEGWIIYIDENENGVRDEGESYTQTDNTGHYELVDVAPGTYIVREEFPEGENWAQIVPSAGYYEVVVASGTTSGQYNFGNIAGGTISGYKWNDENGNGAWDEEEDVLEGVTMYLYDDEDVLLGETETDEYGYYEFEYLVPGTYRVAEDVGEFWSQTYPESVDGHTVTLAVLEGAVEAVEGEEGEAETPNFGNIAIVSLTGAKWFDENADGVWQFGEEGLSDWTIIATPMTEEGESFVVDSARTEKTTTTVEGGSYEFEFTESEEGLWFISEEVQEDWTQTYPTEPTYYMVDIVAEEETYEDYDFGNWKEVVDETIETVIVPPEDMATSLGDVSEDVSKWFFYNDETDTIDNTLGSFVEGPDTPPAGVGSVAIEVTGTQRRNLATAQYAGMPLASVRELSFSTYNPLETNGSGEGSDRSGYLQFNVSFDGTDAWQSRLAFVPRENGVVEQDTWQDWDAIQDGEALWWWSGYAGNGGEWPDGETDEYRTWSSIVENFPNAKMHELYPFFGIRVGEPYSNGYAENLDNVVVSTQEGMSIETTVFDFEPYGPVSLFGAKFNDRDFDGYWDGVHGEASDEDEEGLEGWTITATPITEEGGEEDTETDRSVKEVLTDENGEYEFVFLAQEEGWWRIAEVAEDGWTQTYPYTETPGTGTQYYDVYIVPGGPVEESAMEVPDMPIPDVDEMVFSGMQFLAFLTGADIAHALVLIEEWAGAGYDSESEAYEHYDFGNWQQKTIEVVKWHDENQDGVRNWTDLDEEGNTEGVKDENESYTEDGIESWAIALGRVTDTSTDEEEGPVTGIEVEIVTVVLTDVDGVATLQAPFGNEWYVVLEASVDGWTPIYPDTRTEAVTVSVAEDVEDTSEFDTERFFDFYIAATDETTTTEGFDQSAIGDERDAVVLMFGNYEEPEEEITTSGGGGGGGNGQIVGSSSSAPGFVGGDNSGGAPAGGSTEGGDTGGTTGTSSSITFVQGTGVSSGAGAASGAGAGAETGEGGGTTVTATQTETGGTELTIENNETGETITVNSDDEGAGDQLAAAGASGLFDDVPAYVWPLLLMLIALGSGGYLFWGTIRGMFGA